MSVVAVIPARSGSSLKDKNLLPIAGISLLERALRSALHSGIAMDIVVTSDSAYYLDTLAHIRGFMPHLRPLSASTDTATAQEVIDSIPGLSTYDHLIYLQPTSPFRGPNHVKSAYSLAKSHPGCSVVSVTLLNQYPNKSLQLKNGYLEEVAAEKGMSNSNRASETFFYPNGAIYVLPIGADQKFSFSRDPKLPLYMSRLESIDIDSLEDYELAEAVAGGFQY